MLAKYQNEMCFSMKSLLSVEQKTGLILCWQQVRVGWLVVRCVGDRRRAATLNPNVSTANISTAVQIKDTKEGKIKGPHETFSWTQDAMCWSTLTSRSTFGLRKAREKYWIGLGTGKPVSEYSYWGSRSSILALARLGSTSSQVSPTCCAFVVPHSWRVWQPAYRPIHPAEAAGVAPGPRPNHSLPLNPPSHPHSTSKSRGLSLCGRAARGWSART